MVSIKLSESVSQQSFVNILQIDPLVTSPYTAYRYLTQTGIKAAITLMLPDAMFVVINQAEAFTSLANSDLIKSDAYNSTFEQAYYFLTANYATRFRDVIYTDTRNYRQTYEHRIATMTTAMLACYLLVVCAAVAMVGILLWISAVIHASMHVALEIFRLVDKDDIDKFMVQCDQFYGRFIVEKSGIEIATGSKKVYFDEYEELDEESQLSTHTKKSIVGLKKYSNGTSKIINKPADKNEIQITYNPTTPGRLISEQTNRKDGQKVDIAQVQYANNTSERPLMNIKMLENQMEIYEEQLKAPTLKNSAATTPKKISTASELKYKQINNLQSSDLSDIQSEKMTYQKKYIAEVVKRTIFAALLWLPIASYILWRGYSMKQQHTNAIEHISALMDIKSGVNYLNSFVYQLLTDGKSSLTDPGRLRLNRLC